MLVFNDVDIKWEDNYSPILNFSLHFREYNFVPLRHRIHTNSGTHPASYKTYPGAFPGGKAAGA
jgi:hypothetical protein